MPMYVCVCVGAPLKLHWAKQGSILQAGSVSKGEHEREQWWVRHREGKERGRYSGDEKTEWEKQRGRLEEERKQEKIK